MYIINNLSCEHIIMTRDWQEMDENENRLFNNSYLSKNLCVIKGNGNDPFLISGTTKSTVGHSF